MKTRVVHVNFFLNGRHATLPEAQVRAAVSEILRDGTVIRLFEYCGYKVSDIDVEVEENARG